MKKVDLKKKMNLVVTVKKTKKVVIKKKMNLVEMVMKLKKVEKKFQHQQHF
jgi:hypothetical protein